MKNLFTIKTYGHGELAILFFPQISKKSASVQLSRWISSDLDLSKALMSAGHRTGQKVLTPRQVKIIVSFLGEPEGVL